MSPQTESTLEIHLSKRKQRFGFVNLGSEEMKDGSKYFPSEILLTILQITLMWNFECLKEEQCSSLSFPLEQTVISTSKFTLF